MMHTWSRRYHVFRWTPSSGLLLLISNTCLELSSKMFVFSSSQPSFPHTGLLASDVACQGLGLLPHWLHWIEREIDSSRRACHGESVLRAYGLKGQLLHSGRDLVVTQALPQIFDLKGSKRNRHVAMTGKRGEVLLDENLTESKQSIDAELCLC